MDLREALHNGAVIYLGPPGTTAIQVVTNNNGPPEITEVRWL